MVEPPDILVEKSERLAAEDRYNRRFAITWLLLALLAVFS